MRVPSFDAAPALGLVLLSACGEVRTPLTAAWLEWADSAATGVPFGVRVAGLLTENPASVRIHVRVARDTVTISPYSTEQPCHGICPGVLYAYDTLVWVPAISGAAPRTVVIRAPTQLHWLDSQGRRVNEPSSMVTFGTITVSAETPVAPRLRSVGMAVGSSNTAGCFFVTTITASLPIYVAADQPPTWAPGFIGFAYGRTDPVLRSTCRDDAPVIEVDSIIR